MKDLAEVCPLSRGVLLQLLSISLQGGFCFFPHSFTHCPFGVPYGCLPRSEDIGLTVFRANNQMG
jgi:hypothetical protein